MVVNSYHSVLVSCFVVYNMNSGAKRREPFDSLRLL